MTPFDLAVLLRPPWGDIPVPDTSLLHRERKLQRKFAAVVTLKLPNRKGHGLSYLAEERQTAAVVQIAIQPENSEAGAVIQGGVLEEPLPVDPYELHIDLDRIARLFLRKQAHLLWPPLASSRELA